jgi:hypothetical protein
LIIFFIFETTFDELEYRIMTETIDKSLLIKLYPNPDNDKNRHTQDYEDMVDFIHDHNIGKLNINLPIKILGLELKHLQKRRTGLILVFEPSLDELPIIKEMKRISELQGGHWFNIQIVTYNDVARILKTFDETLWLKLEVSKPTIELTSNDKIKTDELIAREGGPVSSIEYLMTTLSKANKEFIVSQIYYILEVRTTSEDSINEILFKDDLRIDWSLIKNQKC